MFRNTDRISFQTSPAGLHLVYEILNFQLNKKNTNSGNFVC